MTALAAFIAIFVAVLGGTLAAVLARWSVISQLRQAWINALADDLANYFKSLDRIAATIKIGMTDDEIKERRSHRDDAMFSYRRVLLRLNLKEELHRELGKRLAELLDGTGGGVADLEKVESALNAARSVLKAEWEVAKWGWLTPLARRYKANKERAPLTQGGIMPPAG